MRQLIKVTLLLLPLAVGFGVAALVRLGWLPNFLFTQSIRFDLPGFATRLGIFVFCLGLLGIGLAWWFKRQLLQVQHDIESTQAAARRDFLRRLDHELKNPLTIMQLGLSNLRHDPQIADHHADSLSRIVHQSERLQKLIVDLRWLTELDEGSLEQQPVGLQDVLDEAILLAKDGAKYTNRQVTLNIQQTPWPLSPVLGDRELLVIAFRNLLENAFKYTDERDRVEIRATENGSHAQIEVADSGLGIAETEQSLIFENLYRSQDARHIPGRGLGLSLVQQIIGLHGGQISVRSKPQTGTVFSITLPLA